MPKKTWTKIMFDFRHEGYYDEKALIKAIDAELKRQGLYWTEYVEFDAVDYSGYDDLI